MSDQGWSQTNKTVVKEITNISPNTSHSTMSDQGRSQTNKVVVKEITTISPDTSHSTMSDQGRSQTNKVVVKEITTISPDTSHSTMSDQGRSQTNRIVVKEITTISRNTPHSTMSDQGQFQTNKIIVKRSPSDMHNCDEEQGCYFDDAENSRDLANLSIIHKETKFDQKIIRSFTLPENFTPEIEQVSVELDESVDPPSQSSRDAGRDIFSDECLEKHNYYRSKHGVPSLTLSPQLCSIAQEWANHLAETDNFRHRPEQKYGENIYMCCSSNPKIQISGEAPVDEWYSEIDKYPFGEEPSFFNSGHFTQVVWRSSTEMGVGKACGKANKIIVVANYNPAGNIIGSFTANVPPPK
ncbi:probable pathogenesis-related protein CaO19.6200 [Limulus polyphemus]|uniref:Probable pathogenesis-related protein CaO19.6200 n=1 Tax=Limulus polyphemus TaxID=6850 RepID=A0ABM1B3K9_LIMPO|nr:probable pathogenesis-related protein CaO19.6200 [Limulus polyphemus]